MHCRPLKTAFISYSGYLGRRCPQGPALPFPALHQATNMVRSRTLLNSDANHNSFDDVILVHNNTGSQSMMSNATIAQTAIGELAAFPDNQAVVAANTPSIVSTLLAEAPPTSILLLNAVAVIWGTQHAIIKTVVDSNADSAGAFTFLRFGIATLLASRYIPGVSDIFQKRAGSDDVQSATSSSSAAATAATWRWGIELGVWMFLGFAFQAVGLASTTAQRSGFLLYLNVKFVPIFARILLGREISLPTWVSAIVAFCGTALLAFDGTGISLNAGDLWSIAAAGSSAMFILRLEAASSETANSAELNAASLCIVTLFAGIWTIAPTLMGGAPPIAGAQALVTQLVQIFTSHPLEVLYLGGITTALANYIQTKAQKDVSAERASVIYSMDPVYGAIFSYLILGETLGTWTSYFGAFLVFLAAASNVFLDFGKKKSESDIV